MNNRQRRIIGWVSWIVIPIVVVLLINSLVLRMARVSGDSMLPLYHTKDLLFIFITRDVEVGDVVAFSVDIEKIKRVIAIEGQEVTIDYDLNEVRVDGDLLYEPYLNERLMEGSGREEWTVPQGQLFVLGDNRNHSTDSRDFGTISIEKLIGKVVLCIPLGKWIDG